MTADRPRRSPARILAVAVLATVFAAVEAPARAFDGPRLDARAWVLVDAADGEVLAARRATSSYPVASATKLMTAFVATRALSLRREVVAPPYTAQTAESLIGLEPGERIEVRDLLYGLVLASGNDAAAALAEAAAGSVPAFVGRMNAAARRLELDDTSYANPIGLDQPGNFSSAADLADLTIELRKQSIFRRIFDAPEATLDSGVRPRTIVNRNTLVRTVQWVDGVKTGYTLGAGNVLVGSGTRRGISLVSAVLGAPSETARDAATLELLEFGFSRYARESPVREGQRFAAPAIRFQGASLPLIATRGLRLTARADQQVSTSIRAPEEVEGPIERGDPLGEVVVMLDGRPVGTVSLAAARDVAAASILERVDGVVPGPRPLAWVVGIGGLGLAGIALLAVYDRRRARR